MMANTMNPRPAQFTGRPSAPRPVAAHPLPARPYADEVTVCVPGSMLAPAPAAEAPPVFVDDSGTRRKLIRATGCILMLALVGFLGVVGVALALPSVGANVALGNVAPFLIPAAAAKPPAPAPVAFVTEPVQNVAPATKRPAPKPKAKPVAKPVSKKEAPVVVKAPAEKPVVTEPATTEPTTDTPTTTDTTTDTTKTDTTDTPKTDTPKTDTPKTDTTTTDTTTTDTTGTGTTTDPATDPAAPAAENG